MRKSHRLRTRRIRRTTKQVQKHGAKAKRAHKRLGGRSGSIRTKRVRPQ